MRAKIQQGFAFILGDEKRQAFSIPLLAVFLSLLAGAIVFMILGKNPLEGYLSFLQGSGLFPKENYAAKRSMFTDFLAFVNLWTPMIFASLSACVALRAGFFNIGVSGQMLFAGFIASVVVGYSPLPALIAKPLVILVGMLAGAIIAAIMGFLKHKWNINEVVTAIMFNYIIRYITSFFIKYKLIDPRSRQSQAISEESRLSLMEMEIGALKMDIPLAIFLGLVVVIIIYFLFARTRLGFEFMALGQNKLAAQYVGINVAKTTIINLSISGALAGLAGVSYYLGYLGSIQPDVLPPMGFDSLAVCLLGNSNPLGVFVASFFISIIDKGSTYMSSSIGVRQEIGALITGLILLFSACGTYFRYLAAKAEPSAEANIAAEQAESPEQSKPQAAKED